MHNYICTCCSPEASSFGLMKGIVAPYPLAISAYSSLSVETHTSFGEETDKADFIRYAINGYSPNFLMFLCGIDLEPDLAGTSQRILFIFIGVLQFQ